MEDSRRRQVATSKLRYGNQHYETLGRISGNNRTKEEMRLMVLKRWHPDWFDENGKFIEERDTTDVSHG